MIGPSSNRVDAHDEAASTRSHRPTGIDGCLPTLCALGTEPHAHCTCGLPMATSASRCSLCQSEGFEPRPLTAADHALEWDGQRYPSLRLHRPTDAAPGNYDVLLRAILGPVPDQATRPAAAEEAA